MGEWLPTSRRDNLWAYHIVQVKGIKGIKGIKEMKEMKEIDDS